MKEQQYRIWCMERSMWWKPHSNGYTALKEDAGVYTLHNALVICQDANAYAKDKPEDCMVPVNDDNN